MVKSSLTGAYRKLDQEAEFLNCTSRSRDLDIRA